MASQLNLTIFARKTGIFLYINPSDFTRDKVLAEMVRSAICQAPSYIEDCSCPACYSQRAGVGRYLHIQSDHFQQAMQEALSYPPQVIALSDLHAVPRHLQMQLLIWLEGLTSRRTVLMTSMTKTGLLETILSRAFVYQEVPQYRMSDDDHEKATASLMKIHRQDYKLDDTVTPEDGTLLAIQYRYVLQAEFELRLKYQGKRRTLPYTDAEITTFIHILNRYLENPKTHNLPLLIRGLQTLVLMNIRYDAPSGSHSY